MSKKRLLRKYKNKDVDMLSTSETILLHALEHKILLQKKRSTWTDEFFSILQLRITAAYTDYLGIDSAKELRAATQNVLTIQAQAIKDLAEFKVQVKEDFKKEETQLKEILTTLGFTQYHKLAQTGDQEALIQLLYQFKDNITPQIKTAITNKGTGEQVILDIIAHADVLRSFNITQETLKGSRKEITQAAVTEFNEIYETVISIAKIASNFYRDNKAVQDKFSYNRVASNLNS